MRTMSLSLLIKEVKFNLALNYSIRCTMLLTRQSSSLSQVPETTPNMKDKGHS